MTRVTLTVVFLGLLVAIAGCSDSSTKRTSASHVVASASGPTDETGREVGVTGFSVESEFAFQTEQCATGINLKYNCALKDDAEAMYFFVNDDEIQTYTGSNPNFVAGDRYPFSGRNKQMYEGSQLTLWAERRNDGVVIRAISEDSEGESNFLLKLNYIFKISGDDCSVDVQHEWVDNHKWDDNLNQAMTTKSTETIFCEVTPGNRFI